MSEDTPRLRLFAGPNGSGKSELKSHLPPALLGIYLNPDEIEAGIRNTGRLDLRALGVTTKSKEVLPFFTESAFLRTEGLGEDAGRLRFTDGGLDFTGVEVNACFASVAVDFLRQRLLQQRVSFTFESVMSHPGKVGLLRKAQRHTASDGLTIARARFPQTIQSGVVVSLCHLSPGE